LSVSLCVSVPDNIIIIPQDIGGLCPTSSLTRLYVVIMKKRNMPEDYEPMKVSTQKISR
jgi:hypothetical protein